MIEGTVYLTLDCKVKAQDFVDSIKGEYNVNTLEGMMLTVNYHDEWTTEITDLLKRNEVFKAEGELYDDGNDSGEAGSFLVKKENGKVVFENPVFISKLSFKELIDEIKRRTDEGAYN